MLQLPIQTTSTSILAQTRDTHTAACFHGIAKVTDQHVGVIHCVVVAAQAGKVLEEKINVIRIEKCGYHSNPHLSNTPIYRNSTKKKNKKNKPQAIDTLQT